MTHRAQILLEKGRAQIIYTKSMEKMRTRYEAGSFWAHCGGVHKRRRIQSIWQYTISLFWEWDLKRAALCKYRESGADSKFQLFRQKEPFGQVFSEITSKTSSALSFWQNRTFPKMCPQTARRSLKLTNFNRLAWRNDKSTGNEIWQYFNSTSFL